MTSYTVAIIGTGRPWRTPGATGFGMAHSHVKGYLASPDCRLVAVADIKPENARLFLEEHGDGKGQRQYEDYHRMVREEKPDIVGISTWPHLHAEMVIACAEAGVKAVHCEKPMAITFGDCKRMVEACDRHHTQLSFNHQRRFNAPFKRARQLLRDGAIGKLLRIETECDNLYDWGTHWFDMMFFYNNQTPAQWVLGQIETRGAKEFFGAPVEGQGLSLVKFANDVRGVMTTGFERPPDASNRLIGTEGVIEVGPNRVPDGTPPSQCHLRMWNKGRSDWEYLDASEGVHGPDSVALAVLDVIDALKTGREPELSGHRALQATELIFATWESSRRRGRVDLPLMIQDSPLLELLSVGKENGAADARR